MCRYVFKACIVAVLCLFNIAFASTSSDKDFSFFNLYTVRNPSNVWQRMRLGYNLDHEQTKDVRRYERLYTRHPKWFLHMMQNAGPYMYYLLTQTERYAIPSEIALLPGVETSFNSNAISKSKAKGIWQFLPETAYRFSLKNNDGIDDRRNTVLATQAALNYLMYLHTIFKQWDIAIGAYNWGEGNMYNAVIASGDSIGSVDYSDLDIRTETKEYLPKLIALASIVNNPKKFHVTLPNVPNEPYFLVCSIKKPTYISKILEKFSVKQSVFYKLNPQFEFREDRLLDSGTVILLPYREHIEHSNFHESAAIVTPLTIESKIVTSTPIADIQESSNQAANVPNDPIGNIIAASESSGNKGDSKDDNANDTVIIQESHETTHGAVDDLIDSIPNN